MNTLLFSPALVILASPVANSTVQQFDIVEQPLSGALIQIARQGNISILASERLTRGIKAAQVYGAMTPLQAVERVLAGTGLGYRITSDGTIIIVKRRMASRRTKLDAGSANVGAKPVKQPTPLPVEDIVVRAQRRAELARDIPLSISAFGRERLELAGVHKAIDLQQLDPALVISAQSGVIIPFLRGIGNPASSTPGNESSVPVYIDDVYYSRLFPAYLTLDHVDRVEVLKGPQGTLFGRNSTGGLIQIFTRDPGAETEFDAEVGYGNFETVTAKVYAAAPFADNLAVNVSLTINEQGRGWGENRFTGEDAYFADSLVLRSKGIWQPTQDMTVRASAFYVRENSSIGTVQGGGIDGFLRGLPPTFDQAFDQPDGFYDIATDFPTVRRHRGWGGTFKIERKADFADFNSISFYRKSKDPWTSEGDHTPYPWLRYTLPVVDRQITQEFQLKSKVGDRLSWIVGLYYMHARASIDPTSVTGEALAPAGYESYNLVARQSIESQAAYAQATVPIGTGDTRLTGGIRYTHDRVRGIGRQFAVLSDTGNTVVTEDPVDDVSKFDEVTYKFALDHDIAENLMGYVSVSRGFKSGTYNLIPLELPALNPEKVDAYELGLKGAFMDGRLRFNLSAFQNDVTDPQVQIVKRVGEVATNQFVNAQRSRSRGLDLSVNFDPTPGLAFRAAGMFLDAEFVRFEDAPFNTPVSQSPFGVVTAAGDASGNDAPLSPKFKFNVGATHRFFVRGAEITLDGNLSYRGRFKWEPDNRITEPSLVLVNASMTIAPEGVPGWSIRFWGNNITNQRYFSNVLTQSGPTGFMSSPAEPRTFGIALRYATGSR